MKHPEAMNVPLEVLLPRGPQEPGNCGSGVAFVPGAARAAGGTGDALVEVHVDEHKRRAALGLRAVTDLGLLACLLRLPHGELVRWVDLSQDDERRLRSAPDGVISSSSAGIRRVLAYPAAVPLVLFRSRSWRRGLQAASAFEPFAQRVLVLEYFRRDLNRLAWEADVLGVGVWLQTSSGTREVVPPAPWHQRQVKAAGWRFRERAYQSWLTARSPGGWCASRADHRVPRAGAAQGQLQF